MADDLVRDVHVADAGEPGLGLLGHGVRAATSAAPRAGKDLSDDGRHLTENDAGDTHLFAWVNGPRPESWRRSPLTLVVTPASVGVACREPGA